MVFRRESIDQEVGDLLDRTGKEASSTTEPSSTSEVKIFVDSAIKNLEDQVNAGITSASETLKETHKDRLAKISTVSLPASFHEQLSKEVLLSHDMPIPEATPSQLTLTQVDGQVQSSQQSDIQSSQESTQSNAQSTQSERSSTQQESTTRPTSTERQQSTQLGQQEAQQSVPQSPKIEVSQQPDQQQQQAKDLKPMQRPRGHTVSVMTQPNQQGLKGLKGIGIQTNRETNKSGLSPR